jgi:hypothetical protein
MGEVLDINVNGFVIGNMWRVLMCLKGWGRSRTVLLQEKVIEGESDATERWTVGAPARGHDREDRIAGQCGLAQPISHHNLIRLMKHEHHMLTKNYLLRHIIFVNLLVWQFSKAEDLPEQDAKRPHISCERSGPINHNQLLS